METQTNQSTALHYLYFLFSYPSVRAFVRLQGRSTNSVGRVHPQAINPTSHTTKQPSDQLTTARTHVTESNQRTSLATTTTTSVSERRQGRFPASIPPSLPYMHRNLSIYPTRLPFSFFPFFPFLFFRSLNCLSICRRFSSRQFRSAPLLRMMS